MRNYYQLNRKFWILSLTLSSVAWGQQAKPLPPGAASKPSAGGSVKLTPPNMPGSGTPQAKPLGDEAYSEHLQLGDYIELDESIKNELYGTIDFPNADLKDIIRAISKLAGKNFILDRKIEGHKITIISPQPVTKQEAYNAFLSALYMNDLTIVSMGKFLKVVNTKDAIQSNIRVFVGDYAPSSEEVVTVLYPLKYLNAEEIQRFIVDLVPRSGRIAYYPNTNSLVMTDTGLNLRRIIAVLKSLDIPGHEDQLETIPVRYASAKQISSLIDDILEAQNGRRASGPAGARAQPQKTRGGGIITKIVPDERTNGIVVLANGRGVQELRNLVDKLDTPNAAGGGNIHIYFCKNAVAEELATTINALVSSSQSGQSQRYNNGGGYNPGGQLLPGAPITNYYNPSSSRNGGGDGVKLEGQIKVTADKATNSLVVVASGSDFAALKSVLKKLDIPRRQVYVEGTIMEIAINDTKEVGVGFNVAQPGMAQAGGFIPSSGLAQGDLLRAVSTPAGITGLVAGFKAGKSYPFTTAAGSISVSTVTGLIKALVTSKQGQILHQPQILTSDNMDATIEVKDTLVVKGATIQNSAAGVGNQTTTSYDKLPVTISLKINPQIGEKNDLIKLKVEQLVESFSKSDVGDNQKDTTSRKATTTVVVRDGDTVVVGGLQKTSYDDSRSKFPLLGDIPVLGWLFKGASTDIKRSNLVLFLTPRIIKEYNDLLQITGDKIDKRIELGKKADDPKDRLRDEMDKMKEANNASMARTPVNGFGFRPLEPEAAPAEKADKEDKALEDGDELPPNPMESKASAADMKTKDLAPLPTEAPAAAATATNNVTTLTPPAALTTPGANSGTTTLDDIAWPVDKDGKRIPPAGAKAQPAVR
ncbi:MAG: type II secretion system secretin GspD [Bdellovibrionales bacterium]|nr:type II secretion system secretin GspD [Bdellovibrionales bacterium]